MDAAQAYGANVNSASCKAYKAAIQEYLETDCVTGLSAEKKLPTRVRYPDLLVINDQSSYVSVLLE